MRIHVYKRFEGRSTVVLVPARGKVLPPLQLTDVPQDKFGAVVAEAVREVRRAPAGPPAG